MNVEHTLRHMARWCLDNLRESEMDEISAKMLDFITEFPDTIERGYSWPEIRDLALRKL
jgi:hypothetical protein